MCHGTCTSPREACSTLKNSWMSGKVLGMGSCKEVEGAVELLQQLELLLPSLPCLLLPTGWWISCANCQYQVSFNSRHGGCTACWQHLLCVRWNICVKKKKNAERRKCISFYAIEKLCSDTHLNLFPSIATHHPLSSNGKQQTLVLVLAFKMASSSCSNGPVGFNRSHRTHVRDMHVPNCQHRFSFCALL